MKKLLYLCAVVLLGLGSATAFAANVTGTWIGEMNSPDGNSMQLTFTFKQDGTALTGTVATSQGDPLPISEGKVADNKLSFNVVFNDTTIKHEGTINGDEIKLTTKSDNADFPGGELTLKRSK